MKHISQRDAKIACLYGTGLTMEVIGKSFGITRERVRQILERDGIDRRRHGELWSRSRDTVLTKRWNAGYTASQIALEIGISRNAVIGRAHRLKLQSRPSPIIRAA